jgi:hypothetical protein
MTKGDGTMWLVLKMIGWLIIALVVGTLLASTAAALLYSFFVQ